MIPQIIVYKKESSFTSYLNEFIDKNKISRRLIFKIQPLKEEIGINQIREIKKLMSIKIQDKKMLVFFSFHKATTEAQNAFLKILEEKGENNYFLLGVHSIFQVLPTILSRGKIIYLNKTSDNDEEEFNVNTNSLFTNYLDYSFLNNQDFLVESKEQAKKIILLTIKELFKLAKKNQNSNFIFLIKYGIELLNYLENNNLSPQLTIDNYLILIKKVFTINNKDNESR